MICMPKGGGHTYQAEPSFLCYDYYIKHTYFTSVFSCKVDFAKIIGFCSVGHKYPQGQCQFRKLMH